MRMIKGMLAVVLAMLLVACGNGGCDAGSSPLTGASACSTGTTGSGTTTPTATAVNVLSSSPQVGTGGDQVTISAIVTGAGNVSLPDTAVSFSTSSGILTSVSAKTDSAGVATAVLASGSVKNNRSISVSVTSGSASGSVNVQVVGTKLKVAGASTVPLGQTANLTITASDSKDVTIAGLPITVSSSLGNRLSSSTLTTDGQGSAVLTYTATNAGTDTLTFSGGGTSAPATIVINGQDFAFTTPAPQSLVPVNTQQVVTVRYRSGGVPVANQVVNFAATAGTFVTPQATTDAGGFASATLSSTTASPATVQATLQSGLATATLPIEFVALIPASVVLQVSPTAVAPNLGGSTLQQAQLIATVKDAQLNPVSGVVVNFNRLADPSGGNLSQATATTDSSGQASVKYIAGATTTSSNGVQLRASVASAPGIFGDASLTVNQSALFIALGTSNEISNFDPTTYKKDWTAYVTDANGIAVPGIKLTIKVLPVAYRKGSLVFGTVWDYAPGTVECTNEDANYNGTLDAEENDGVAGAGNPADNADGQLQPGNVISVTPGTLTTDSNGRATMSLLYAESYAPWVKVKLSVQAVVSGTESTTASTFVVSGSADDFTNKSVPPAGIVSPFGVNACNLAN